MNADPLYQAVKDGNLERVKNIFEKPTGIKIDKLHDDVETVIAAAVRLQHTKIVEFLADKGADVNKKTYSGKTPLHLASFEGNLPITEILVKHGAKQDIEDDKGRFPLHWAVKQNRADIAKVLVQHGGDVNAQCGNGETILHEAIANAHREVVESLLEAGADVRIPNEKGIMAFHVAAKTGRHIIAEILTQHGADINDLSKNGESALHLCSLNGQPSMVKYMIENQKVDLEYINKQTSSGKAKIQGNKDTSIAGWTALQMACAAGHDEVVKILLDYNADKDVKNKEGKTAKELAVLYKRDKVLMLFGDLNADDKKERRASVPVLSSSDKPSSDKRRSSVASKGASVGAKTGDWRR